MSWPIAPSDSFPSKSSFTSPLNCARKWSTCVWTMARRSHPRAQRQTVTATPPRLKPSPKTDGSLESIFALFAPWCANFELGNHCPSSTYVQELRHPGAQISNTQLTSNNEPPMKTMNTPTSTQPEPSTSNVQPETEPTAPAAAGPRRYQSQPPPSADSVFSCSDQLSNQKSKIKNQKSDISRLPKPTRDMLNVMLDDGLPYHVILDELGETANGLTASGLAQWVKAGYADYLEERQTLEDVKTES